MSQERGPGLPCKGVSNKYVCPCAYLWGTGIADQQCPAAFRATPPALICPLFHKAIRHPLLDRIYLPCDVQWDERL